MNSFGRWYVDPFNTVDVQKAHVDALLWKVKLAQRNMEWSLCFIFSFVHAPRAGFWARCPYRFRCGASFGLLVNITRGDLRVVCLPIFTPTGTKEKLFSQYILLTGQLAVRQVHPDKQPKANKE